MSQSHYSPAMNLGQVDILKKYPGIPLVGVFQIKTQEITLMPCIPQKVALLQNNLGEFIKGWEIDANLKHTKEIDANRLQDYIKLGFAPRIIYLGNEFEYISAHEYMLKLMGETKNESLYRGFAVTYFPNQALNFMWVSGALNSQRDEKGRRIQRTLGAKMSEEYQHQIEDIIYKWVPELKKPQPKEPNDAFETPPQSPREGFHTPRKRF
ncbi:MAG: hypothetical protein P4M12_01360 [Gammaproteobacteria bacterium]|nr:hypothetical protein [Gammaproteobacteria bacterium]